MSNRVQVEMLKPAVRMNGQIAQELSKGQRVDWDAADAQRAEENGLLRIITEGGEHKRK